MSHCDPISDMLTRIRNAVSVEHPEVSVKASRVCEGIAKVLQEQGFIKESLVCDLKSGSNLLSKEEILKQLQEKNVSCKDVTFKIFGLSLTTYNILISLLITISTGKIYFNF